MPYRTKILHDGKSGCIASFTEEHSDSSPKCQREEPMHSKAIDLLMGPAITQKDAINILEEAIGKISDDQVLKEHAYKALFQVSSQLSNSELLPVCYRIAGTEKYQGDSGILIEMREGFKGQKWAVKDGSNVLNKSGEWEYEPIPSSRTDTFIDRTRFDSPLEALQAFKTRKDAT